MAKPLVINSYGYGEPSLSVSLSHSPSSLSHSHSPPPPLTEREKASRVAFVTATSTGVVTALSASGRTLWQTHEGSRWGPQFNHRPVVQLLRPYELSHPFTSVLGGGGERQREKALEGDSEGERERQKERERERESVLLEESVVLVYGEEDLVLFSLSSGERLFSLPLPATLAAPPHIQDIDCDHVRDLVLTTTSAYIGYRLQLSPSFYPLILPVIIVLLAAIAVYVMKLQISTSGTGSGTVAGTQKTGAGAMVKKVFKTLRATDASHLD
jgi:hypothetical protein